MLTALAMAAALQGEPAKQVRPVLMQTVQVSVAGSVNGRVVLDCQLRADGGLDPCAVASELPAKRGFAKAAQGLVAKMKLGAGTPGRVSIPITFTAEEAPENLLRDPQWISQPTGDDFSIAFPPLAKTGGQGDLNCMVGEDGGLKDCIVTDVAPLGVGYAEAVLMLAPRYKLQTTARDGSPAVGRPIKIPLRFVLE